MTTASVVLAALYLRRETGKRPLPSRAWPIVVCALRKADVSFGGAAEALRQARFWAEAAALEAPGLLAGAEALIGSGEVLTAEDSDYPGRWLAVLGAAAAPPALWKHGVIPQGPFLTIVGSRDADLRSLSFAKTCAETGCALGFSIASGAAIGCDAAAADGASEGNLLEIVPFGAKRGQIVDESRCLLSIAAPGEPFSRALAMERNTLLYALSEHAIIAHARFREGGTWHGAVNAQRRRFCRLVVREDPSNPAHLALVALGAKSLASADSLGLVLGVAPSKPLIVREPRSFRLAWSGGSALL